ncbi:MAG: hypothetical protein QNJ43_01415 [Breoghania sp.]|nr:hypothetical protein [Breoghania sp.]
MRACPIASVNAMAQVSIVSAGSDGMTRVGSPSLWGTGDGHVACSGLPVAQCQSSA